MRTVDECLLELETLTQEYKRHYRIYPSDLDALRQIVIETMDARREETPVVSAEVVEMTAAIQKFVRERRAAGAETCQIQQILVDEAFWLCRDEGPATLDVQELHFYARESASNTEQR